MRAMDMRHAATQCTFATRLRAAREHARLTQDQLAAIAKITSKRVLSWEIGSQTPPEPEQIGRMASAMRVPSLWLMAGELAGPQFKPDWYTGGAA